MPNSHDLRFHYYKQVPDMTFIGTILPHLFGSTTQSKNFTEENLSKKTNALFLHNYTIVSYCLE